ncbi:MAG: TspO/MBR family protein [Acutalibacter sp.]|nr:tryptophan-rich sensory protein [Candidatus Acutalibacter stercoravium]
MIKLKPLAVSLFIALGTGGLSALLTQGAMERYRELEQPPLSPPGWVFPVVWSALFVLMGIAAYLVWMRDSTGRNGALALYGLQLALNFCWTLIFFNLQNHALAFFWLLLLWLVILLCTLRFFKETPAAGWLMVPYLIWVAFAGYLNAGVWLLNAG